MSRLLSSRLTFVQKLVFPAVWIGLFAIGTITMFVNAARGDPTAASMRWIFLAVLVAGIAWIYWLCGSLVRVELSGDSLLVSNYRRSVRVPLAQIERVSGSILMSPELVWIRFRRPTELGDRIVFMGRWRWSAGFSRHPVVAELTRLAATARHLPPGAEGLS